MAPKNKPMHELTDKGVSVKGQSVKPVPSAHDALKDEDQRTLGEPSDYEAGKKEVLTGEDTGEED
jgi:hypothetical protein